MHKVSGMKSNSIASQLPPASNAAASSLAVLSILLLIGCNQAIADEACGPAEVKYVNKIASGLQKFASRVTKLGRFETKEDFSTDGTQVLIISFVDRGRTLFVHRVFVADPILTPTAISPVKTRSGEPGFTVVLVQGHLGACEYNFFVRDAKFIVTPQGFKR